MHPVQEWARALCVAQVRVQLDTKMAELHLTRDTLALVTLTLDCAGNTISRTLPPSASPPVLRGPIFQDPAATLTLSESAAPQADVKAVQERLRALLLTYLPT